MNCRQARRRAWEANLDLLAPRPRRALRRHLDSCPACAAVAADWPRLMAALEDWREAPEPSPSFDAALRARIAAAEAAPLWARFWRAWRDWAGVYAGAALATAALAVVLAIGGGTWFAAHRNPAAPVMRARSADAAVRDLQVLDRDGEMLENFDLIGASSSDLPAAQAPGAVAN